MLLLNRQKPTTSGKSAAGTMILNSPLYMVCAVAGSVVMFIREPCQRSIRGSCCFPALTGAGPNTRQADGAEIVARDHRLPRRSAKASADGVFLAGESGDDALGQPVHIEKVDEPAIVAVANHLFDRRREGADDEAPCRQRFEQRPGEYEGVGQIDVNRRDLQYGEVLLVRQRTEEMNPPQIERAVEFSEHCARQVSARSGLRP